MGEKKEGVSRMVERAPGIYEVKLYNTKKSGDEIRVFLIPGNPGEKSLMVDTGYAGSQCLSILEEALKHLGIKPEELDIFLTHKHMDHCGLASEFSRQGARLFMNPEEDRHSYDCLRMNKGGGYLRSQAEVLRAVGVTREQTPEVWEMFMDVNRRVEEDRGWYFEIRDFSYEPVKPGQTFCYGAYTFETVPLRGHTYGQMGLYDRENKIFFSADQVIDGIVPIVATSYPDEHLLKEYFASLKQFKDTFAGCRIFPSHREELSRVSFTVDRILFSYLDKTGLIESLLKHSRRPMTVRELACLAYGMKGIPSDEDEFIKLKMVMTKTFSCLEYLYDEDFALRENRDGILYWETP